MNSLPALAALFLLCSCSAVSGNRTTGKYAGVFVGTDAKDVNLNPEGFTVAWLDNSTALRAVAAEVRKMWADYLLYKGITYIAGEYFDLEGAKLASDEAVKLEELRNARSAQEARAQIRLMEAAPVETVPLL